MDSQPSTSSGEMDQRRKDALKAYRAVCCARLCPDQVSLKDLERAYSKTEDDIKAVQSVGQIIGEVMKQLDDERFIVKASSGPRYVVSYRPTLPVAKLKAGHEFDPLVYKMSLEDPGGASFAGIGGLGEQVRELREIIELPLLNPELFQRVGIKPPKGVLLYGPPGTGKTLLARAVAATLQTNFLKVVSSAIVDKYIGESARVVREMFGYARDHEPCVIFMDEIDAIGGRRFSEGTSADREIQRTLMEVPLPNEQARLEILKIHAKPVNKSGDIDYEAIVKVCYLSSLSDGFNGADLRNVITEAGMFAIRDDREYVTQEDLTKAARKVSDAKKHESKSHLLTISRSQCS
ncbi:26S proteasome [Salix suchowensis]|nr:26S proteasome [Salix suchowensis]